MSRTDGPTRRWSWPLRCAGIALVALKLWLVTAQPVVAIAGAVFDDRLFLSLAQEILHGRWLGDYSQFTLMKGPMYSLWIAGTWLLHLPLPLAQHLLYLLGCGLVVRALRPWLRAPWQEFAIFTLLWWQPMSYELSVLGRILRQNLYTPTALLFFAALCALETRRTASRRVRIGWGLLLGVTGGALWLTREEGIWIAPAAALLAGFAGWNSWRAGERLRPLLAPLLAATLCAGGMLGGVCALNRQHYGWFGTVEFRAPEFLAAYGALQRPISRTEFPYVPVTREVRLRLYDVSPAFAELRPFLEGDIGRIWAGNSAPVTGLREEQREIAGGWFMWALRESVVGAGHMQSARAALDFYARLADEINRACDAGLVGPVRPRHATMVPPWRAEHTTRLRQETWPYLQYFFLFRGFSAYPASSYGDAGLLELFRDLTRWQLARSPDAPNFDSGPPPHLVALRLGLLQRVGKTFRWISAAAAIGGIAAWAWLAFRVVWRGVEPALLIVASAALGSALASMAINLLVHVLSFPNRSPGALAQAYPLLVLFGAVAWIGALSPARPESELQEPAEKTAAAIRVR